MSENIPQTSASERVEAAQRAIMWLSVQLDEARATVEEIEESREADNVQDKIDARDSADNLLQHLLRHGQAQLDALRALITPPSVGESEEAIAERVIAAFPPPYSGTGYGHGELVEFGIAMLRAGIQSAHESWEPADRPSQEMMLRWLELDYEESTDDEGEPSVYVHGQHIEREEI
ncbi:hypothetical protein ACI7YT_12480 [Microbacterium sp. M]|uniref:hypothetical protein n=1 Tax=Microbacterium sp. M TaxID=3377125 RepID=UPI00387074BC